MNHIVLFVISAFLFVNRVPAYAEDMLQYELTHDKIKKVCVFETREGLYTVAVELNKPAKKVFSQLTENNIGKKLDVVISRHILMSAVIKEKIDSGVISVGEWSLDETAKKIKEILKKP